MKEDFSNKVKIFHDSLEKRNVEVEKLKQVAHLIEQKENERGIVQHKAHVCKHNFMEESF